MAETFGQLFLRHPDLFPARRAGEPWGRRAVRVDFVGGPYRFHGLADSQAEQLHQRFGPLASDLPPETETAEANTAEANTAGANPAGATDVLIFRVAGTEFLDVELDGWAYTFDRDYHPDHVRVAGLRFQARIDWTDAGDLAGCLFTPEADGPFFLSQVENYFRLLVAYRLLDLGGVLLHSAGVVSPRDADGQGVAHVFVGHSGAGKTTISRRALADGRIVLSDDMNAICPQPVAGVDPAPEQRQIVAEKLPFAGDLGRTPSPRQSHPLAGIYRLRQGENQLRPLGRAEAVAFLLGCCPFVNVDPHRIDGLTANLEALSRRVPTAELTFSKAGGFWPLVDGGEPDRAAE